jgi:hypothetical protein
MGLYARIEWFEIMIRYCTLSFEQVLKIAYTLEKQQICGIKF